MAKPHPILPILSAQDIRRFQQKILVRQFNDCWLWQAGTDKDGYGFFGAQGRGLRAHRVAYLLATGIDPSGALVLHHCDTPACCNPNHLFLGDHAANAKDRNNKERQWKGAHPNTATWRRGENQHCAKLTPDMVKTIRDLRTKGFSATQIYRTAKFPVSRRNIAYIIERDTWRHV